MCHLVNQGLELLGTGFFGPDPDGLTEIHTLDIRVLIRPRLEAYLNSLFLNQVHYLVEQFFICLTGKRRHFKLR